MDNLKLKKQEWISWFLLVASPAFCYLIFELITGNLLQIDGQFTILNLLFYYTIFGVFLILFRHMRSAYLLLNVLFTVLAVAEFYVVSFRARPIMLADFLALQTAATVAGNYNYALPLRTIVGVLLMAAWNVLIWKFPFSLPKGKKRAIVSAAAITWAVSWFWSFFNVTVSAKSIDVSMWEPVESYANQGYLLCTIRMFAYLVVERPEGYQHDTVAQLYEELETTAAGTGVVPVNIICIMNESWSDLSVIAPFETNLPTFSYYNSLDENCIKGKVYVPVYGSMTSNTEYEFLTGNSMAFAPVGSVPFQIYMKDHTVSLLDSLKQYGFHTIGMHPYPAENWNRSGAYKSLGFDEFLAEEYFDDSPRIRDYVSDRGCFDKVIQITEDNDGQESLFFFVVTMQNHGGYEQDYDGGVYLTEYDEFPKTEQYLSLMRETDEALEYLIEYYRDSEQPTLIMMFGDHQPGIEQAFYEALYGGELSEMGPEDYLRRYMTPYVIWTNYENNLDEQGDFSVLYLQNQVLKAANLPLNGYQTFLEQLKEEASVIHMKGYYDSNGVWQSWTDWRLKESYSWMQKLDWFQYYRMFDKKRK